MQDNVHIGLLTVKETITYAAELRLDENMKSEDKANRVQTILNMLGLNEVGDTLIGNENIRGVSGGQLKRVSIGVEIINLPDLMFFDEPTTGLDSAISFEVMAAVRNLANQNRTVICTIHQVSDSLSNVTHSNYLTNEIAFRRYLPTIRHSFAVGCRSGDIFWVCE